MKKFTLGIVLITLAIFSAAAQIDTLQSIPDTENLVSVEDKLYSVNLGLPLITINAEYKLGSTTTIRSEIGAFYSFEWSNTTPYVYAIGPVVTVEPRWYYNLNKRARKHKITDENNGNFLALEMDFFLPSLVYVSESRSSLYQDLKESGNTLSVVPMWGMRRQAPSGFTWTVGTGLGPAFDLTGQEAPYALFRLEGRIGWTF